MKKTNPTGRYKGVVKITKGETCPQSLIDKGNAVTLKQEELLNDIDGK